MVDEELNERGTRLEQQVTAIQKDVRDTRTLVAGIDHDVAELKVTQRGHTSVLNAVSGNQVELRKEMDLRFKVVDLRFNDLEQRMQQGFAATDRGFEEVHGKFATMKISLGRIIELLEREPPA